jgi:lipoate-protein ligase A
VNKFRLIVDPPLSGSINMAKDLVIQNGAAKENALPVFRIYRWLEPTVSIGYSQNVDAHVNRNYCKKNHIPVVRRESGGGTVLHHMELTYSFTIQLYSNLIPDSVDESFRKIIAPIMSTLKIFVKNVEYRPVNDILINKRKISGSAQIRKHGVLQQHGTIIVDIDDKILTNSIYHDELKLKNNGFSSPRQSVTSLKEETGKDIDERFIEEFITSLINNFSNEFHIDFNKSGISEYENSAMEDFANRFASDKWNFKK